MSGAFRKYGIFLLIPGTVLVFSVFLKIAAGPYWLATNFDPSYQYIVNGLYLIKGIVPNHTDHPGTPLQMLCAAVCWLFNMGRPAEVVVTNVLKAPEFYLRMVFIILSLLSFFTSLGLGLYVFRKTGDRLAAVLAQLPALSFLTMKSWESFEPILPVVANVDPEPLLMSVLNLFNICLLMNFYARTSKEASISTIFWGLVCGWGAAIKLTFIPIVLVPLIVLSWKNRFLFVCIFAATFVAWTLPILSKYPIIWGWVSGIATHKAAYGTGGASIGNILSYGLNWENIVLKQAAFGAFLFMALVLISGKVISKKWDRGTSFLAATMAGIFFQFSAVTQHPGAHYLLPGIGLFSSLFILLYLQSPHVQRGRITCVLILIGVLWGAWQANGYRFKLAGLTKDVVDFHEQARTKYQGCTFINYYRSSSQAGALFFGDGSNLSPHFGEELFQLYPQEFYFHIWGNRILGFNGRVWSNDLLIQDRCVLFQGDGKFDFSDGPYSVQLLEKGRFESIHILTGTTEKQAALLLAGAMQFMQSGEYGKAMGFVLQARKLHYQPDSSVERLIQVLGPAR